MVFEVCMSADDRLEPRAQPPPRLKVQSVTLHIHTFNDLICSFVEVRKCSSGNN